MSLIFNTASVSHWLGHQKVVYMSISRLQLDALAALVASPAPAIAALVFRPLCPPLASHGGSLRKPTAPLAFTIHMASGAMGGLSLLENAAVHRARRR